VHDDLHEKQDNDRENGREERAAETEAGSIAMPLAEQPRQYRASRVIRPARVRPPVDASQYRPGEQLESYPTSAESSPAAVTKEASRSEPHGSHYDRASAHEQAVQAEYDARLAALEALEVAERERHDVPATSESISVPAAESVEPPRVEMRARSEGHATPPVGGGESRPPSFPHGCHQVATDRAVRVDRVAQKLLRLTMTVAITITMRCACLRQMRELCI